MSGCPSLSGGAESVAGALRAVDCLSGQATAVAFGRLFGAHAALGTALTLMLTLYVALLAVNLLTGRSALSLSLLTPRMLGLGLALTFATSWVAYQSVVWTLATGAPDQIATLLAGTHGSATALFADRLDRLFGIVADAAQAAQSAQGPDAHKAGLFAPADLLWIAALMLLLGTVGVLLTARIALAALLALGPVFIVLALFRGTRGLFEGWLKGVALFALVPLFATLIGGAALALIAPAIDELASGGGEVSMQAAVTVFLATSVYLALMAIVGKVATTLTAGWRLPWTGGERPAADRYAGAGGARLVAAPTAAGPAITGEPQRAGRGVQERTRAIVAGIEAGSSARGSHAVERPRAAALVAGVAPRSLPAPDDDRSRRLVTAFRPAPTLVAKEIIQ